MDSRLETKQLPVHFVSAAGLVYRNGKVLLIRSARRGWEFPGGIVEQGGATRTYFVNNTASRRKTAGFCDSLTE